MRLVGQSAWLLVNTTMSSNFNDPDIVNGRLQADVQISTISDSVGIIGAKLFWDHVTSRIDFNDTGFTTTYTRSGCPLFIHELSFKLNTSKACFKLVVDGQDTISVDFDSFDDDDDDDDQRGCSSLALTFRKRQCVIKPSVPLLVSTDFEVQLKSEKNTKRMERLTLVWGPQV